MLVSPGGTTTSNGGVLTLVFYSVFCPLVLLDVPMFLSLYLLLYLLLLLFAPLGEVSYLFMIPEGVPLASL